MTSRHQSKIENTFLTPVCYPRTVEKAKNGTVEILVRGRSINQLSYYRRRRTRRWACFGCGKFVVNSMHVFRLWKGTWLAVRSSDKLITIRFGMGLCKLANGHKTIKSIGWKVDERLSERETLQEMQICMKMETRKVEAEALGNKIPNTLVGW